MMGVEKRGAEIRQFLLEHVEKHPTDIVSLTAETFGISRQGVHRHIQRLRKDNTLEVSGTTRNRRYRLRPRADWLQRYALSAIHGEDIIWSRDIRRLLDDFPENGFDILQYGFTEMMNNVLEHSAGRNAIVHVKQTAIETLITIADDGEGIFK